MNDRDCMTKLFTDFSPISKEQWEEIILKDLKGADYTKKLVTQTYENIPLQPYYTKAEPTTLNMSSNDWIIRQSISRNTVEETNKVALDYLNRGLNSLTIRSLSKQKTLFGTPIFSQEGFNQLFEKILIEYIPVNFNSTYSGLDMYAMLINLAEERQLDLGVLSGTLDFDPLDTFSEDQAQLSVLKEAITFATKHTPKYKLISISGDTFHNAGANAVQELAFSFSKAVEYAEVLSSEGLEISAIFSQLTFSFGVGSNYFMEIAKLRAARILWEAITTLYNHKSPIHIISKAAVANKSTYDSNVNMLRLTTEAMSAAIGGANEIELHTHTSRQEIPNEFSERISRNIQLILKGESYLDQAIDPSEGSYYIESLTQQLVDDATHLFQTIESKGGYLSAYNTGFIQNELKTVVEKRQQNIQFRKDVILGTNQFPNPTDTLSEKHPKTDYMFNLTETHSFNTFQELKQYYNSGGIRPYCSFPETQLQPFILSEEYENLRLRTEKSASKPRIFLLTIGHLGMRKARANFALNFFGCAGFEVIDNNGFSSTDEAISEAKKSGAEIIVLCSSDDEYMEIAPSVCAALPDQSIVVAGFPKTHIDSLKEAGIETFIHVKTNAIEVLTSFQNKYLND